MAEVEQKRKLAFRKLAFRSVASISSWTVLGAVDAAVQCTPATKAEPWAAAEAALAAKAPAQSQERGTAHGEARGGEDPPARPDHPADMVGSMVGVYNGKTLNQVEIKPEMIGHYLGEFFITYKPVKHSGLASGPPTPPSFIPLK